MQHVAENLMTALNYINILTTWVIADLKIKNIYWCGCFISMGLAGGKGREVDKHVCIILIGLYIMLPWFRIFLT